MNRAISNHATTCHGSGETAIQRGVVSIFYSGAKWVAGTSVNDSAADVTMFGGDQFGWFGWSLGLSVWKGQVRDELPNYVVTASEYPIFHPCDMNQTRE